MKQTCSNCHAKLKESFLTVLDGNPKHKRLCPKCSKTIIIPPSIVTMMEIVYLQSR